jgi:hypothetical protein
MLNKFLSKVIWVDFKNKRVLCEQQGKVKKIPFLCQKLTSKLDNKERKNV